MGYDMKMPYRNLFIIHFLSDKFACLIGYAESYQCTARAPKAPNTTECSE